MALTLRLLGGLTTEEIARAFLTPEPTIGQRISRAKRTLADADIGFEVPDGVERAERLASVLEVVYLIFNEGYSATAGDQWVRKDLCAEALRLGRILAALTPRDAEVHGLVALMEIQASRLRARTAPDGSPIRLVDQDRGRWDHLQIRRGLAALDQAERRSNGTPGPYTLQAAIAAGQRAGSLGRGDRLAAHRRALRDSRARHAVADRRAEQGGRGRDGVRAGDRLPMVDALADDPSMRGYHLLPSVRGDLLARLGRGDEASVEFTRAAALTRNVREREFLLDRASAVVDADDVEGVQP